VLAAIVSAWRSARNALWTWSVSASCVLARADAQNRRRHGTHAHPETVVGLLPACSACWFRAASLGSLGAPGVDRLSAIHRTYMAGVGMRPLRGRRATRSRPRPGPSVVPLRNGFLNLILAASAWLGRASSLSRGMSASQTPGSGELFVRCWAAALVGTVVSRRFVPTGRNAAQACCSSGCSPTASVSTSPATGSTGAGRVILLVGQHILCPRFGGFKMESLRTTDRAG